MGLTSGLFASLFYVITGFHGCTWSRACWCWPA